MYTIDGCSRRKVDVEKQANVSVLQKLEGDHGLLEMEPFAQSLIWRHEVLVSHPCYHKHNAQNQRNQHVVRIPGITLTGPSECQDDQAESEQEKQLATDVDGCKTAQHCWSRLL